MDKYQEFLNAPDMPEKQTKDKYSAFLTSEDAVVKPTVNPLPSFKDQITGGGLSAGVITEPLMKMGSGLIAKPVSDIAGLAATAYDAATGNSGDPEGFKKYVQDALTYTPKTGPGMSAYNPLNVVPEGIGKLVNSITTPTASYVRGNTTDNSSFRGMAANAIQEAIPQAIGIGGAKLSKPVGNAAIENVIKVQENLNTLKQQNIATDAVIKNARDAGYVFTPTELSKFGSGHPVGSMLEDVGALRVNHMSKEASAPEYKASLKNYEVTKNQLRSELKMPDGSPVANGFTLSEESLSSFIKDHSGSYSAIKALKTPMVYTPEYLAQVGEIGSRLKAAIEQYPDLMKNPEVARMQDALTSGKPAGAGTSYHGHETGFSQYGKTTVPASTTPAAAMEIVQKFREDASKTLKNNSSTLEAIDLANIKKQAASAVEDLIAQSLQDKPALYEAFKRSRENIAKAYEIKDAMEGTVFIPQKFAKTEAPLTGNLKTIRDMALQHPKLMLDPRDINTKGGGYAANAAIGGIAAAIGHPMVGAAIAARPLINDLMLTKPYQSRFARSPDYSVGGVRKALSYSAEDIQNLLALTASQKGMLNEPKTKP